jgi:hypothetical protein
MRGRLCSLERPRHLAAEVVDYGGKRERQRETWRMRDLLGECKRSVSPRERTIRIA